MITGAITLNGLDDSQMAMIFEHKAKTPGMTFNAQAIQPVNNANPATPGKIFQKYNNVILGWITDEGLKTTQDILHKIQPHHPN